MLGGGAVDPAGYFVCFHVRNGATPAGVTSAEFFNDIHELLGARPSTSNPGISAFGPVGPGIHTSPLPASLSTLDALMLRSTLQTTAFQTENFEATLQAGASISHTSALARIGIKQDFTTLGDSYIRYESEDSTKWALYPSGHHLDNLTFFLTDTKGRSIISHLPTNARTMPLPFSLSLRWDAVAEPAPDPRSGKGLSYLGPKPNAIVDQT